MRLVTCLLYLVKQELLRFVLEHVEDKNVEALLEVCETDAGN
jgi:hypothetical protein